MSLVAKLCALALVAPALAACRDVDRDRYASPDAATYDGPRMRVATFNVRRFFDTVCDSGTCGPDEYEELPSQAAFEQRAEQIADAVRALDADVVSLQEIETQSCLDAILAHLGDDLPWGVLGETAGPSTVDVAVLSRTPIDSVVRHRANEPLPLPNGTVTSFSRELLETHVTVGDTQVVLFAAHFKSKSSDDPPRRLAEAQTAARIVGDTAEQFPDALVILAGDLNDTPGSPPLDALTVAGGLVRVADDLSPGAQATYLYGSRAQAIDHILLAPTQANRRIPLSSRTWRDGRGYGGSDHFALTSDLVLP